MYKKVMAVALLLITTLCLTACPSGTGLLPAEEIIEKAVQALDDVKTYLFEMDMNVDYGGEVEGEVYEAVMALNSAGTIDLENKQVGMEMVLSLVSPGILDMEARTDMYIMDGMLYESVIMPGIFEEAEWQKSAVPQGYWENIEQIEPQLELLELAQAEVTGTEKIGDIDCYVLQLTPDFKQLWQVLAQQMTMGEIEDEIGFDMETLQDMFKDFSVKQWIAEDTYFIARAELNMAIEVNLEDIDPSEEGIVTMNITMDLLAYDYNQPVSIVLPEGAEEAEAIDIFE